MPTALHTIDVQKFIDERRLSPYQWYVLVVCFLLITVDVYDVVSIGYAAPALINEWGISKVAFGPVISVGIFGTAIGALIGGPISDLTSPKRMMIGMIVMYSLCSIASAFADSLGTLAALRFFTGLGVGAAVPVGTVITHEFVPSGKSSFLVNVSYCGGMVGASVCGLVAAALLPNHGWQSIFLVGGIVPLILALLCAFSLPEPLRFMVIRNWPADRIATVLRRIAPGTSFDRVRFVLSENESPQQQLGVAVILSPHFRVSTLMLWITYFLGVLVYYLLMGWMPTVLRDSGITLAEASMVTSLLTTGGAVGAIALGWLMDRFERNTVLAVACTIGAAAVWIVGQQVGNLAYLAASTFMAGVCIYGALASMPALAASSYTTNGRTTGISWMYGIGRLGGVLGPIIGGLLLRQSFTVSMVFTLLAIPTLIQTVALLMKRMARNRAPLPDLPPRVV